MDVSGKPYTPNGASKIVSPLPQTTSMLTARTLICPHSIRIGQRLCKVLSRLVRQVEHLQAKSKTRAQEGSCRRWHGRTQCIFANVLWQGKGGRERSLASVREVKARSKSGCRRRGESGEINRGTVSLSLVSWKPQSSR